ncbi:Eco57I restriction-modification methylase domain-containing protein [Candidatus Nanosalina sp. VS9-1]|uniref:Eco57I restriction-modification methylase domain-containing protein n=1 Tax=Candidatus Nanosalina sp. VS9-1 TaxID=3388566 RepID=UPI0039DF6F3A
MASLDQKQKREKVQELLKEIDSPEKVYEFFEEIGYENSTRDPSYKRDISEFNFKEKAEDKLENIYTVLDYQDEITVLLIETESLSKTHVRYVTERLARKFNYILPIFTSDFRKYQFVFPTFDETTPGEIDIQLTTLEVDSENVFYSDADALSKIWLEEERNFPHVWNQWEKAFSIDKVTEQFFEDYQEQFFHIRGKVLEQVDDVHDAHEYTLQFMNRMMFVYFVDKKGWLEGEEGESYIQWLWDKYRKQGGLQNDSDEFYNEWLDDLFHKAFNNKFTGNPELPQEVNQSFQRAPYLNGGLFRENSLSKLDVELEDSVIEDIIHDFFERYNFTIKEDSPVDKEVAVDPQMIGYVYESLSNVAEQLEDLDKDSRKEFGIFYTPKEEVYFMVRRSLVEYLENNTGLSKNKIYKLVFAEGDEEKKETRKEFTEEELEQVKYTLQDMKSVDPACGSGAFLVGIIDVISEIFEQIEKKQGSDLNMFEAKKEIIQNSIYGVDVKDWAINASELRLFLQLLIETDIPKEEIQRKALLPNLRANLRVGDSLVQDIDGIFFDLRENQLEGITKSHMEEIQKHKSKFFEDRSKSKYDGIADIQTDEIKFFQRAIDDKIEELEEKLEEDESKQQTLNGETKEPSGNEKRQITRQKKETRKRIEKLEELKQDIIQEQDKMPMLWEVAFAEVFNNNGGFDLLIGNPPYVRQEDIAPPNMDPNNVSKQDKKDYKNKLIESVQNRMPQVEKISKRSDLYIYFYFHGLSLINDEGTFAFITSNSWLDVGYGKELQQFLCKHVPIKGIYNNKNNRSFEHADVNTVISIFGAPNFETKSFDGWEIDTDRWPETDHNAQFVTFKKPYREAVSADNMIALENDTHYDKNIQLDRSSFELYNTQDLRSVQITQGNLLEDGWQYPENYEGEAFTKGKYDGNKWGGKFLKAPDAFYKILNRASGNITELGDFMDIRSGCYSGINDFFYLDEEEVEEWDLEDEYIVDLFKSPKESDQIELEEENLKKKVLLCRDDLETVKEKAPNTYDYIEWGSNQERESKQKTSAGTPWPEVPSVNSRSPGWWAIPNIDPVNIFMIYGINQRYIFWHSEEAKISDRRLHMANLTTDKISSKKIVAVLNSTITPLMIELIGRSNLGQGALDFATTDANDILFPDPEMIDSIDLQEDTIEDFFNREIKGIFEEVGLERGKPIREQEPEIKDDRKKVDDAVFDALGLSEGERKEVYWSVAELVKARLDKAESV